MLPKLIPDQLPGTVLPQWVRCGKPGCKCARGELHGPYFYRFYRDDEGKQHKKYVRPADLAALRAACDGRRAAEREGWRILRQGREAISWLLADDESEPSSLEEFERILAYPFDVRDLLDSVVGKGANPRQQVLMFRELTRLMSVVFEQEPPSYIHLLLGEARS